MDTAPLALALGCDAAAVARTAPLLRAALARYGDDDWLTEVGLFATVATETDFIYARELADGSAYEGRLDLGNTRPGDGPRYKGAGWIEITGRSMFAQAGAAIGLDLVDHPELAAQEPAASTIAAWYFHTHHIPALCHALDWGGVRYAVNGGYNGWDRFMGCVHQLLAHPPTVPKRTVTVLGVRESLRLWPREDSTDVADLAPGATLCFLPAPSVPSGVTPHWAYVELLSGTTQKLRPARGLKGWLLRANLRTTFV